MNLTVVDHPLARHYLTTLRNSATGNAEFRAAARRLTNALVMEATKEVPTHLGEVVPIGVSTSEK